MKRIERIDKIDLYDAPPLSENNRDMYLFARSRISKKLELGQKPDESDLRLVELTDAYNRINTQPVREVTFLF